MAASAVVAASAVAVSGVAATATSGLYPALIGFGGTVVGAALAQGAALFIAHRNRSADARKDAISRAFNTAGSHMATVAFDKYVEFCEAYGAMYREALLDIMRRGPCKEAVEHSVALFRLRQKWSLWLTPEVEKALKKFEDAMMEIGSHAWYVERTQSDPNAVAREESVNRMMKLFSQLGGLTEWKNENLTEDLAVSSLLSQLRTTLGTEQFDRLRQATLERALRDFDRNDQRSQ
jgi:hypothetical protein